MNKVFNMSTEDAVACALFLKMTTQNKTSIMIADMENIAMSICSKLEQEGYQCTTNFSRNEFISFLNKYADYIDYNDQSGITLKNSNINPSEIWSIFNASVIPYDVMRKIFDIKNSLAKSQNCNTQNNETLKLSSFSQKFFNKADIKKDNNGREM